jgi:hypothetical protein
MNRLIFITFLALFVISCTTKTKENTEFYSVDQTLDLLIEPSYSSKKLIDAKASSITDKEEYCSVDNSNKMIVLETQGRFSKVKIIEPQWQTDTYIGWIPSNHLVDFGLVSNKTTVFPKVSVRYEILNEEKLETSFKAQLIEYVFYKDTLYTREALTSVVTEIYNLNRDKDVFDNYSRPTVIAIYLFTSVRAIKDKSNWIAMLIKGPNDAEPRISINDFKVVALSNANNKSKSRDEIELEKLKKYLNERGLELCDFSDMLNKIALDNIHKADAKYPEYGDKHMAMVNQLDVQSNHDLKRKYKVSEDMMSKVSIFAMAYCK